MSENHQDSLLDEGQPRRRTLLADRDVFAEEQQAKQDALNAMVDSLAAPSKLEALQSFLASDAAQKDKIDQLVTFLADGPAQDTHDELLADTDVFADEQEQKQKTLEKLVDSLAKSSPTDTVTATALLATNADDVDFVNAQTSFLNVIGGAVLLLVAVVLAAVTKQSRSKRETEDERKDFGYSILYE